MAVPSGSHIVAGLSVSADGALYVTYDTSNPGPITGTAITATTQYNVGASGMVLNQPAAGVAMFSGDGTGTASGNTGWKFKNISGTTSGMFHSAVTSFTLASSTVAADDAGNTEFNATNSIVHRLGTIKFRQLATAGWGPEITAGTAATNAPRALSVSQGWTDGTADNIGVVINITEGTATGKALSIQTGAGGITEVFAVSQDGTLPTLGVRGLSTLTDGADGTNTSGYKFVSFVSNSAEAGNVIRVGTTAAVVFTTTSDERMKKVLGDSDLDAATDRVMSYRMKDYEWKSQPGTTYVGPLAQQVHGVNKTKMLVPDADQDSWGVNMSGFVPDLIMAVQQQQARIAKLEAGKTRRNHAN